MKVQLRFVADHVDYHEHHLLLLVRQLDKVHLWQLQLVVDLENILVGRQRVDCMVVGDRCVLVHLHSGCTTAHLLFLFFNKLKLYNLIILPTRLILK